MEQLARNERWLITENEVGLRLDLWLVEKLAFSRSQIKNLISEGKVLVNGQSVKAGHSLKLSDEVVVSLPTPVSEKPLPENLPLDVIYEDDDLLIVNKPVDVVVHPGAGNLSGTLVNALLFHYPENLSRIGGQERPGIVHRLDKETTGLLMIAKNDEIHKYLSAQLKLRKIGRFYNALVHGVVINDHGTIDAPIGRHPVDRKRMTVIESGRRAITHFQVIERYQKHSFLECELVTGRTHQIRVHLSSINHPIVGDKVYGRRSDQNINSQLLHAYKIAFEHPKKGWMEFIAPLPEEFREILMQMRKTS